MKHALFRGLVSMLCWGGGGGINHALFWGVKHAWGGGGDEGEEL